MPDRNVINLLRFIAIITIMEYVCSPNRLRAIWDWNAPHVSNIYDYIGYDDDLRILCRMVVYTFDYVAGQVCENLKWPKNWYKNECNVDIQEYDGKCQSSVLSPKDRLLRYYMQNTNHSVPSLISTFGQNKSTIYSDYKFIAFTIVKVMGDEWCSLLIPGTPDYDNLIGQGVFSEEGDILFDNVPYVCDVTSVQIARPRLAQRTYYNGHKKCHTVDFHCTHSGTGRVYGVTGPIPGSHNDVQAARTSLIYRERNTYLSPNHAVLADLAYYHIGKPFLCRISFQESYTELENQFNMAHSRARVISENWYGRFKGYWTYFGKPWQMRLQDIGISFRALTITTNVIITMQDPLRR